MKQVSACFAVLALFAGCGSGVGISGFGNPCTGIFTDAEIDGLFDAVEHDFGIGISKQQEVLDIAAGCRGNFECRPCGSWVVDSVYP